VQLYCQCTVCGRGHLCKKLMTSCGPIDQSLSGGTFLEAPVAVAAAAAADDDDDGDQDGSNVDDTTVYDRGVHCLCYVGDTPCCLVARSKDRRRLQRILHQQNWSELV